jgi:hypothetical protein
MDLYKKGEYDRFIKANHSWKKKMTDTFMAWAAHSKG